MTDISALNIFLIAIAVMITWSVIKSIAKWSMRRNKPKFKKEYEVTIFINGRVVSYQKYDILKVKLYGRKYIEIKLRDGSWIEYEGFNYIVQTYKIDLLLTPVL